ncbi:helix-turn-helix domain-containing protein [Nonomuraea sediminis]|uniref:helix-turn-helix domain-containing protein n=1 Tax=Nonomuraea sediminis TaxID=2835864 RepID=UPI001BDCC81F|nr:pyridoxamine 5'-phosphate oxidase family protein [Nonomuraea sediminis]
MTVGSDLGRRIVHHRERLGLSREQVAELAGMSPGYLQYLEEQPGSPSGGALFKLASALQTTVDELLGGRTDRPPGHGQAMADPVFERLDTQECLRLIEKGGIGRVAFEGPRGPTVMPVNYRVHEGAIVFRTADGGPMDDDLRTGVEGVDIKIAFEVDCIDEACREGWSVLVQGPAHHLTQAPDVDVTPWAGGERNLYVRIVPHQITGRRIHAR